MTPEELKTMGHLKFGHGWQTKFAKTLGVSHRSVNGWSRGERDIPRYAQLVLEGLPNRECSDPDCPNK